MAMHSMMFLAMLTSVSASLVRTKAVALRAVMNRTGATGFGTSACPCVGFDKVEGTTVASMGKGKTVEYPLEMGGSCTAWDDNTHPSCKKGGDPGKGNGWCAQPWCYVDPCNCNIPVPPKVSSYMPDATYQAKPVYYSYATCGGKDEWTGKHHKSACVNQKSSGDCAALSKCAWTGDKCLGKEVVGQCTQKLHGFTWGMGNCRCIGIDDREGVMTAVIGKDKTTAYPSETGGTCAAWDSDRHPDCMKADAPSWCKKAWCYVDPCSCSVNVPPTVAGYVPDGLYQGRPIYYSYDTCGSTDDYTAGFHKTACKNQKSEKDCTKLKKCGWTGKECLGKDLVEVCTREPAPEPKSEKAGSWVPSLSLGAFLLCQVF